MGLKTRIAAGLLAATAALTMSGCGSNEEKDEIKEKTVLEEQLIKYDNNDLDLYQVITIDNNGKIETVLAKLYANPYNSAVTYKLIADIKVVYEYDRDTNKMTSYYDIIDIVPLAHYLSEEEAINLGKYNDDEVINMFYKNVINVEKAKVLIR